MAVGDAADAGHATQPGGERRRLLAFARPRPWHPSASSPHSPRARAGAGTGHRANFEMRGSVQRELNFPLHNNFSARGHPYMTSTLRGGGG